ncbi:unnamed protein product [Tetraodon nigroviridis]|uniref:(spotted green pufferfish) hypothetical protein n=1 Tax=Tetraodon nigroviridis TaxID=99883 RepID=Q4T6U6_TETNG|nr:unnamed protein product [Tetraodon nigroviridis]
MGTVGLPHQELNERCSFVGSGLILWTEALPVDLTGRMA